MFKSKKKFIIFLLIISCSLLLIVSYSTGLFNNDSEHFKLSEPDPLSKFDIVEFNDSEGNKYNISDFSGKFILMNFWATWCLPCRVEMPSLDNLQEEMGDENFQVIIVSVERTDFSKVDDFLKENNIKNLSNYHDPTTMVGKHINAKGLPITILFDKNGKEIGRYNGDFEWDSREVVKFIAELKNS